MKRQGILSVFKRKHSLVYLNFESLSYSFNALMLFPSILIEVEKFSTLIREITGSALSKLKIFHLIRGNQGLCRV